MTPLGPKVFLLRVARWNFPEIAHFFFPALVSHLPKAELNGHLIASLWDQPGLLGFPRKIRSHFPVPVIDWTFGEAIWLQSKTHLDFQIVALFFKPVFSPHLQILTVQSLTNNLLASLTKGLSYLQKALAPQCISPNIHTQRNVLF